MADAARLIVDGVQYGGWKSVRIVRSIESLCGSFELSVSDRWAGQPTVWPIREGAECQVLLDDDVVLTGYVDSRSVEYDAASHSVTVAGRDKAGDLVDCSAVLDRWEFTGISLLVFAKKLCDPFGVSVSLQAGMSAPTVSGKLSIDPGDTAWGALESACRRAGVLAVSDGQGGIVLARAGSGRASTALVESENILRAGSTYDASGRYRTYRVLGQRPGSDSESGATVSRVKGEATDLGVRRPARILMVKPEGAVTTTYAKTRAQWEAIVHAAKGDSVSVTVQGWRQRDGTLWSPNRLVPIRSPMLELDGTMLISSVTHSLDQSSGSVTELSLVRPDAYAPEPAIPAPGTGGTTRWRELD